MFLNITSMLFSSRKYLISGSFPVYEILKTLFPVVVHITKIRRIKLRGSTCGYFRDPRIFDLFGKKLPARRVTVKVKVLKFSWNSSEKKHTVGFMVQIHHNDVLMRHKLWMIFS